MRLNPLQRPLALGLWSLLLVLSSGRALAQAEETDQAGRALREASTLRDAGDVEGARERLEEAHARWPADARVTFALGSLRVSEQDLEAGWSLLREASEGSEPLVREAAAEQLALLSPQVAVVIIDVQSAPCGARLSVGGESVPVSSSGEVALALAPGEHEVILRDASGVMLARGRVHASRGSVEGTTLRAPGAPVLRAVETERSSEVASGTSAIRVSDDDVWIAVGVASASVAVTALVTTVIAVMASGRQEGEPMGTVPGIVLRGRM